jgi:tRNA threonylcarbamoyladenosine biosynthesis protein TsaE
MEIIYNLDELNIVSRFFVTIIEDYKIFTFGGELGSGKTTLISAICKNLGVTNTVTSPTYSIIQEYQSVNDLKIYHVDLYRISNTREAIDAGVEECLMSGEICFLEWPENAALLLPKQTVSILFETLSEKQRKLIVQLPQ